MESKDRFIEFIAGSQYTKLKWRSSEISDEMVIDAIDNLGKIFLTYFNSTFLNFLNDQGCIVAIDTIVEQKISLVFVRGPDGNRNQLQPYFDNKSKKFGFCAENFQNKKFFSIKNCALVEENLEKKYSLKDVAKHCKKSDCWLVLNGKVYDVTEYINSHPGGNAILRAAGKDGTELFNKTHPWVSETIYKGYCIGALTKNTKT